MKKSVLLKVCLLMTMAMLTMTGCSKYKKIKVTSHRVESCKFEGLRAANLGVALEVDNPAGKIEIFELTADVKYSGKVIGKLDVAPFKLTPRQKVTYHLNARASLAEGFGLRDVMAFFDMKDVMAAIKNKDVLELLDLDFADKLTADVNVVGKASGMKVKRTFTDVPLKKLLRR